MNNSRLGVESADWFVASCSGPCVNSEGTPISMCVAAVFCMRLRQSSPTSPLSPHPTVHLGGRKLLFCSFCRVNSRAQDVSTRVRVTCYAGKTAKVGLGVQSALAPLFEWVLLVSIPTLLQLNTLRGFGNQ